MSLIAAIFRWLCCLLIQILVTWAASEYRWDWLVYAALTTYFANGIYLSRTVLAGLVTWHPVHATIGEMASTKLAYLAFWPFLYVILFFQLAVTTLL